MDNLPLELRNIIYRKRALCTLYDNITRYNLNFNRLCEFLIRFGGVIGGSFALSCFDNTIIAKDLDIFINSKIVHQRDNDGHMCINIKAEFFKLVNNQNTFFGVNNRPVSNTSEKSDITNRVIKFCGFGDNQMNMIDLVLVSGDIENRYFDIGCTNILFNGIDWIFPTDIETDIEKFIMLKSCSLNPFKNFFAEIYDPWHFSTVIELTSDSSKFILNYDVSKVAPQMKPIFDLLINFYPKQENFISDDSKLFSDLTKMKSLSGQYESNSECDFSLSQYGDPTSTCRKCNNIISSMQKENITHKYFPIGYIPYYVDCNHKYSDAHFLTRTQYVFPPMEAPEGEKLGLTKFVAPEAESWDGRWETSNTSEEEYADIPANVWPEEGTFNDDTENPYDWPHEQINNNDSVDAWPGEEKFDDFENQNEIDWENAIPCYPEDNVKVECPSNLVHVAQSFFPNNSLSTSLTENTNVNLKTYIKIYTIYRFWYRVLKYISRGYTIFGIFDTLKGIIETDVSDLCTNGIDSP